MKPEVIAEFVLTYSWGILIVGIVISAMAILGFFEWSVVITPTCEAQEPFTCLEALVMNTSAVELVVRSTSNDSISLSTVRVSGTPPCGGVRNASVNGGAVPAKLAPRDVARIIVECANPWAEDDLVDMELVLVGTEGARPRNGSVAVQGVVGSR